MKLHTYIFTVVSLLSLPATLAIPTPDTTPALGITNPEKRQQACRPGDYWCAIIGGAPPWWGIVVCNPDGRSNRLQNICGETGCCEMINDIPYCVC